MVPELTWKTFVWNHYTWPMPSRWRRSERRGHEYICGKILYNAIRTTNCTHTVTRQHNICLSTEQRFV